MENTSSDSRTFFTEETPTNRSIKKDLIEIDLSLSTIIFLKFLIGFLLPKKIFRIH